MKNRVNIGCGRTPTPGWINLDNSPAIKLANAPIKYRLAVSLGLLNDEQIENVEWNKENSIGFADATKSIPLASHSVNCVYSSHMFEHLSREGAKQFLSEAFRVLESGGVLRISIPDLKKSIDDYNATGDADKFITEILVTSPPINTLKQKLLLLMRGYRHHQWMYDGKSLAKLMVNAGFRDVAVQAPGETLIEEAEGLDLFERRENSVYVEGRK